MPVAAFGVGVRLGWATAVAQPDFIVANIFTVAVAGTPPLLRAVFVGKTVLSWVGVAV